MSKIGIVTINDNNNYGNRLQNYAVQETLKKIVINREVVTLKNEVTLNNEKNYHKNFAKYYINIIKSFCKKIIKKIIGKKDAYVDRKKCFLNFNKNIKFSSKIATAKLKKFEEFDFFITGSDQVWNPTFGRLSDFDLLNFAKNNQKISFAASFGISNIENQFYDKTKKALSSFKSISVREERGKEIIEELTGRDDIEVLIDPTMLLDIEEWNKVLKKPKQINKLKSDKYILNYFLGELSDSRRNEIERIAKENDCEIINILDKESPFYLTGPSEFLYLEKNAFLICTDSFHSCVFAFLYGNPFIIFDREDELANMNSRIDTFIKKFNLKNRSYNGINITKENMNCDYTDAYKILEKEREKSNRFLKNALNA